MKNHENVVLILLTVITTQISLKHCMPSSRSPSSNSYDDRQNPFLPTKRTETNGFLTRGQNAKIKDNTSLQKSMYKVYNFPDIEYPLDNSPRNAFYLGIDLNPNSFRIDNKAGSDIGYTKIINGLKKKLRMDRMLDRINNGKICHTKREMPSLPKYLSTSDPIWLKNSDTFPEVQYPMNVMETWMPNYWNPSLFTEDIKHDFSVSSLFECSRKNKRTDQSYEQPPEVKTAHFMKEIEDIVRKIKHSKNMAPAEDDINSDLNYKNYFENSLYSDLTMRNISFDAVNNPSVNRTNITQIGNADIKEYNNPSINIITAQNYEFKGEDIPQIIPITRTKDPVAKRIVLDIQSVTPAPYKILEQNKCPVYEFNKTKHENIKPEVIRATKSIEEKGEENNADPSLEVLPNLPIFGTLLSDIDKPEFFRQQETVKTNSTLTGINLKGNMKEQANGLNITQPYKNIKAEASVLEYSDKDVPWNVKIPIPLADEITVNESLIKQTSKGPSRSIVIVPINNFDETIKLPVPKSDREMSLLILVPTIDNSTTPKQYTVSPTLTANSETRNPNSDISQTRPLVNNTFYTSGENTQPPLTTELINNIELLRDDPLSFNVFNNMSLHECTNLQSESITEIPQIISDIFEDLSSTNNTSTDISFNCINIPELVHFLNGSIIHNITIYERPSQINNVLSQNTKSKSENNIDIQPISTSVLNTPLNVDKIHSDELSFDRHQVLLLLNKLLNIYKGNWTEVKNIESENLTDTEDIQFLHKILLQNSTPSLNPEDLALDINEYSKPTLKESLDNSIVTVHKRDPQSSSDNMLLENKADEQTINLPRNYEDQNISKNELSILQNILPEHNSALLVDKALREAKYFPMNENLDTIRGVSFDKTKLQLILELLQSSSFPVEISENNKVNIIQQIYPTHNNNDQTVSVNNKSTDHFYSNINRDTEILFHTESSDNAYDDYMSSQNTLYKPIEDKLEVHVPLSSSLSSINQNSLKSRQDKKSNSHALTYDMLQQRQISNDTTALQKNATFLDNPFTGLNKKNPLILQTSYQDKIPLNIKKNESVEQMCAFKINTDLPLILDNIHQENLSPDTNKSTIQLCTDKFSDNSIPNMDKRESASQLGDIVPINVSITKHLLNNYADILEPSYQISYPIKCDKAPPENIDIHSTMKYETKDLPLVTNKMLQKIQGDNFVKDLHAKVTRDTTISDIKNNSTWSIIELIYPNYIQSTIKINNPTQEVFASVKNKDQTPLMKNDSSNALYVYENKDTTSNLLNKTAKVEINDQILPLDIILSKIKPSRELYYNKGQIDKQILETNNNFILPLVSPKELVIEENLQNLPITEYDKSSASLISDSRYLCNLTLDTKRGKNVQRISSSCENKDIFLSENIRRANNRTVDITNDTKSLSLNSLENIDTFHKRQIDQTTNIPPKNYDLYNELFTDKNQDCEILQATKTNSSLLVVTNIPNISTYDVLNNNMTLVANEKLHQMQNLNTTENSSINANFNNIQIMNNKSSLPPKAEQLNLPLNNHLSATQLITEVDLERLQTAYNKYQNITNSKRKEDVKQLSHDNLLHNLLTSSLDIMKQLETIPEAEHIQNENYGIDKTLPYDTNIYDNSSNVVVNNIPTLEGRLNKHSVVENIKLETLGKSGIQLNYLNGSNSPLAWDSSLSNNTPYNNPGNESLEISKFNPNINLGLPIHSNTYLDILSLSLSNISNQLTSLNFSDTTVTKDLPIAIDHFLPENSHSGDHTINKKIKNISSQTIPITDNKTNNISVIQSALNPDKLPSNFNQSNATQHIPTTLAKYSEALYDNDTDLHNLLPDKHRNVISMLQKFPDNLVSILDKVPLPNVLRYSLTSDVNNSSTPLVLSLQHVSDVSSVNDKSILDEVSNVSNTTLIENTKNTLSLLVHKMAKDSDTNIFEHNLRTLTDELVLENDFLNLTKDMAIAPKTVEARDTPILKTDIVNTSPPSDNLISDVSSISDPNLILNLEKIPTKELLLKQKYRSPAIAEEFDKSLYVAPEHFHIQSSNIITEDCTVISPNYLSNDDTGYIEPIKQQKQSIISKEITVKLLEENPLSNADDNIVIIPNSMFLNIKMESKDHLMKMLLNDHSNIHVNDLLLVTSRQSNTKDSPFIIERRIKNNPKIAENNIFVKAAVSEGTVDATDTMTATKDDSALDKDKNQSKIKRSQFLQFLYMTV